VRDGVIGNLRDLHIRYGTTCVCKFH